MGFTKAQNMGFRLRLGMRKKNHYHLRNIHTGDLVLDPNELGPKVEQLISCLDSEKNGDNRKKNTNENNSVNEN
jgi:hypothetical protein